MQQLLRYYKILLQTLTQICSDFDQATLCTSRLILLHQYLLLYDVFLHQALHYLILIFISAQICTVFMLILITAQICSVFAILPSIWYYDIEYFYSTTLSPSVIHQSSRSYHIRFCQGKFSQSLKRSEAPELYPSVMVLFSLI